MVSILHDPIICRCKFVYFEFVLVHVMWCKKFTVDIVLIPVVSWVDTGGTDNINITADRDVLPGSGPIKLNIYVPKNFATTTGSFTLQRKNL